VSYIIAHVEFEFEFEPFWQDIDQVEASGIPNYRKYHFFRLNRAPLSFRNLPITDSAVTDPQPEITNPDEYGDFRPPMIVRKRGHNQFPPMRRSRMRRKTMRGAVYARAI
jgi:hypothetical protein